MKEQPEQSDNELIEAFNVAHGGKPTLKADLSFYESDWNMLMPVVEKIMHMYPSYLPHNVHAEFVMLRRNVIELKIAAGISVVYKAVVEFIKWYNQQNH